MDLVLDFEQRPGPAGIVRIVRLHFPGLVQSLGREGIFFEFVGENNLPEPRVLDGFMFCFLRFAMKHAKRFVIRGPVSARALRNAGMLQEAWRCWFPGSLHIVDVLPDVVRSEGAFTPDIAPRALAAFSGGVDATFLALRHALKELGASSFPLTEVVSVHGFDIPLAAERRFTSLMQRTEPLLRRLQLARRILRTNIRSYALDDWELSYGSHVACALHQYDHQFSYGLLASSAPYSHIVNRWGSCAATDYLFGGSDFEIVHEGAGYTRSEKVDRIKACPEAVLGLSVCWEGGNDEGNCGICDKCVRTRLNFMVAGVRNPSCFKGVLGEEMIKNLRVSSGPARVELLTIVEFARSRRLDEAWLSLLEERLASSIPAG